MVTGESLDANTVALNKYLKEQEDADRKWEETIGQINTTYGDTIDEIQNYLENVSEDTGYEVKDLWNILLEYR